MNLILAAKFKLKSIEDSFVKTLDEPRKKRIRSIVRKTTGYDLNDWLRVVMYQESYKLIEALEPQTLNVLEISPGNKWLDRGFKRYRGASYPEFDICKDVLDERFDLIIADQVWEHLEWPYRATRNVHEMLVPGGHFLVLTPFLIRVHRHPIDCSRWTEQGLAFLVAECGFSLDQIVTGSWGNRAAVRACLRSFPGWPRRGYGSLKNEPDYPLAVWALARKGLGPTGTNP